MRLIWLDEFEEAFFVLDGFFDAGEVFLVLEIVFLDIVESLLFRVERIKGLRSEEVCKGLIFFEEFKTHFEVIHLEFDQVVYQDLVEVVWESIGFVNFPELFHYVVS